MSADDIIKIIEGFPKYIQFFYPGYLTMYVYYFLRSWTINDTKALIVKSLAISSIYAILLDGLIKPIFRHPPLNVTSRLNVPVCETAALIFMSMIFAYLGYVIVKSRFVISLFGRIGIRTSYSSDEFQQIMNDNGTWLCIYLNDTDVVYEGFLICREMEEGRRKFICLSGFYKYKMDGNGKPRKPYIENHAGNNNEKVVLYLDDIARIEVRDIEN